MSTLKRKWDRLMQYSTGLAAILVIVSAALVFIVVVSIGILLAKFSVVIK